MTRPLCGAGCGDVCRGRRLRFGIPGGVPSGRPSAVRDRVLERLGAVVLAKHFRDAEDLSIARIAEPPSLAGDRPSRLLRPRWRKARAVKARCVGVCRAAAARTRNCPTPRATPTRTARPATRARARKRVGGDARLARTYGKLPTSYDCSCTHARRRGGEALERLAGPDWPTASSVSQLFGSGATADAAAWSDDASVS
jgi:hypothetical protein